MIVKELTKLFSFNNENESDKERVIVARTDKMEVPLEHEFDVEDGILYLTAKRPEDLEEPLTISRLERYIDSEADDSCWEKHLGESEFLNCEVYIFFDGLEEIIEDEPECFTMAVSDNTMEICTFVIEDDKVKLATNYDPKDYVATDSIEDDAVFPYYLSVTDANLIMKALDFYGDHLANTQGYSSGEQCWDLMKDIKTVLDCKS